MAILCDIKIDPGIRMSIQAVLVWFSSGEDCVQKIVRTESYSRQAFEIFEPIWILRSLLIKIVTICTEYCSRHANANCYANTFANSFADIHADATSDTDTD